MSAQYPHLAKQGFKKGQSGNPLGRPKIYHEMTKLARTYSTERQSRSWSASCEARAPN
jgi:Family of unknown function (DUF5681)